MNTSNLIVHHLIQSQPVRDRRSSSPYSLLGRWHRLLLSAVFLLMACGLAKSQQVNVLAWTNGQFTVASGSGTISGMTLKSNCNVLVAGIYVDANSTYGAVTYGGVAPDGYMNVQASGTDRMGVFYWINPKTTANQSLVVNYGANNPGYYWLYQLTDVNTVTPVVTSGTTTANANTTSLTTTADNSFVVSFFTVNASGTATSLTPNAPLIQTGTTIGNLSTGASIASATNNAPTAGLESISWTSTIGAGNQGVAAVAFQPTQAGAPLVSGSVSPAITAPTLTFALTATITPGYGTVTNVSVNLTPIGGTSANNLVQSSNPNVWTNSFTVPNGAPIGNTNLIVTAMQNTNPVAGYGRVPITIAPATGPTIVQDTQPTNSAGINWLYLGQGITFSASFTGAGPITNQWQFSVDAITSWTDIPGATNSTYTIPAVQLSDSGYYRLVGSNPFGSTQTTPDWGYVDNSSTPTYLWSAPIPFAGLTAEQILTNSSSANKIAGAMVANASPITVVLTNAGNEPIQFAAAGNWAKLSGGVGYATGANTNQTGNASFNNVLNDFYYDNAVHNITLSGLVVGYQYQVQLFALDNRSGNGGRLANYQDPTNANDIVQNMPMGDNVYVLGTFTASNSVMTIQQNLLSSAGNFNGLVLRTVGWDPPPYFAVEPANAGDFLGTNAIFTGSAAADSTIANPTITYQWASGPVGGPYTNLVEGSKYAGVTTTTLTISNLVVSDGYPVYVLLATDSAGTATSREAALYVQSPPILPVPGSFGAAVLDLTNNNLVGLWQLNETNDPSTGLLVAYDASGNGHSGQYANNSHNAFNGVQAPQPPTFGGFATGQGALQTGVGGTSDINSLVNLPPLNTTNGVATTICMWINPSQNVGYACGLLFTRYGSSGEQAGFGFCGGTAGGPNGNESLGYLWNNANGEATYNYNPGLYPANNTWNFVALVMRTNSATFYLMYVDANGAAHMSKAADTAATYTQQTWSSAGGANAIWLGGDQYPGGATPGGGRIFPGRISNVAMFNSALNDNQITALFSAGYAVSGFPAAFAQQPPATITSYTGFNVQISTQTGGTPPITNQWMFNGTNLVDGYYAGGTIITGSTSNVLTLANVSTNWNGIFNLAITNVLAGTVSSNATVTVLQPAAPPSGNLVGHWIGGATNLTDLSGYTPAGTHDGVQIKSNGVAVGSIYWTNDVPANSAGGKSLYLNNAGINILNTSTNDAGYDATFDVGISNAMTVTFWAKGFPGSWNAFVSKYGEGPGWQLRSDGNNNVSPCWTMRGNPGTVGLGTAVYGNAEDMAATSLTYGANGGNADNKWHFYCGTYDLSAGVRNLYVDGNLVAYTTGQGQYNTSPATHLVIGAKDQPPGSPGTIDVTNNFTGYYRGWIYDVRIYNVALSGSQQAYIVGPPQQPPQKMTASVTPPSGGNPGQLVLNWLNGGLLLQTTNVAGPWTTNTSATPPYTVPMTNRPAEFYKVLFP